MGMPSLNKRRIRRIFDTVFDLQFPPESRPTDTSTDQAMLLALKAMQIVNLQQRQDAVFALYRDFDDPGLLEPNSEGTTLWLAMALAVQEYYAIDAGTLRGLL